jgi:hypothetical protein
MLCSPNLGCLKIVFYNQTYKQMQKLTFEQILAKGIAEKTEKHIITNDGMLYVPFDGVWIETGVIALDVATEINPQEN